MGSGVGHASLILSQTGFGFRNLQVYTQQNAFQKLEDSFLSAAFTPASLSSGNLKGLAPAMEFYLRDVNQQEPALASRYEKVIPEVKRALPGEAR